jgi:hypothetical protein
MASLSQELRAALDREGPDVWEELTKRLMAYTFCLLRGRHWRCVSNGVPPDGFNTDAIVAQAFGELFAGSGWEPKGNPYTRQELEYELKRLALNLVRRLERRKENVLTLNEPDLTHGEDTSDELFFDNFAGNSPVPDGELERKEAKARLQQFQIEFITFLGPEKLPRQVFDCVCEGLTKRDEQAKRLGVSPQDITNARKRLDRKLDKFAEQHPQYPNQFINEVKDA